MGNRLGNALNYLDPARPGKIEVWAEENESETIFYVRDNGQGIAAQNIPRLFKTFQRLGQSESPGEGIGQQALDFLFNQGQFVDQPRPASLLSMTLTRKLNSQDFCQ